jgi:UPF0716 family protein affecting phage T7 exclusion
MVMFLLLLLLGLWRMMMMMMFQFVGGFCFLRRRGWCIGVGVRESAQKKASFGSSGSLFVAGEQPTQVY